MNVRKPTDYSAMFAALDELMVNESLFSIKMFEKRDSSYVLAVGTQGFPIFALMQGISEKC